MNKFNADPDKTELIAPQLQLATPTIHITIKRAARLPIAITLCSSLLLTIALIFSACGPRGASGVSGLTGETGAVGAPGEAGAPGAPGADGAVGTPGTGCTVQQFSNGVLIICGETQAFVKNGKDGCKHEHHP